MKLEYEYQGQVVEFDVLSDDSVEVNATEMAKIFGKKTNEFLRLPSTKAFIEEMARPFPAKRSGIIPLRFAGNADFAEQDEDRSEFFGPLYRSETGGDEGGGTWMHEVLALKFAAWLNVSFEVWVYRTIRAILRGDHDSGSTRQERTLMRQEAELTAKANQLQKQLAEHPLQQELNQVQAQRKQVQRTRTRLLKGQMDLFVSQAQEALPSPE